MEILWCLLARANGAEFLPTINLREKQIDSHALFFTAVQSFSGYSSVRKCKKTLKTG